MRTCTSCQKLDNFDKSFQAFDMTEAKQYDDRSLITWPKVRTKMRLPDLGPNFWPSYQAFDMTEAKQNIRPDLDSNC